VSDGRAGARPEASPRPARRSLARFTRIVFSLAVMVASVIGLTVGAVHGLRSTAALSTDRQAASWELDDKYWDCLTTQAHSLVRPGQPVWMDTTNLTVDVTLVRVFGSWADVVDSARQAQVYVTVGSDGTSGCLGTVILGLFDGPRGPGTVTRKGSGASLPGSSSVLPTTPL
jgi:hypothetical protein